jgi:predicted AAA+ superfamily ATPase
MDITRSDRLARRLALENPWWDTGRIPTGTLALPPRAFYQRMFERVADAGPGQAIVVSGAPGVGKTTLLLHLAEGLIESGTPARRIVYMNLRAPVFDRLPLDELVARSPEADDPALPDPLFVFVDDCHVRRRWRAELDALATGPPGAVVVAASGLRAKPGGAGDAILPPLTFFEYVRAVDPERAVAVEPDAKTLAALDDHFLDYLNEGALPHPPGTSGGERLRSLAAHRAGAGLGGDLPQRSSIADTTELARVFATVAERTGTEIGIEDFARTTALAKNTVRRHLDFLEAAHLIARLPRIEGDLRGFERAVTVKAHLTSAAYRAALLGRLERDDPAAEAVAETAIVGQWLHTSSAPRLRFARWGAGATERTVDLVCIDPTRSRALWAVDVTWSNRAYADDAAIAGLSALAAGSERAFPRRVTTRTLGGTRTIGSVECAFSPISVYALGLVRDALTGRHPPGAAPASGSASVSGSAAA